MAGQNRGFDGRGRAGVSFADVSHVVEAHGVGFGIGAVAGKKFDHACALGERRSAGRALAWEGLDRKKASELEGARAGRIGALGIGSAVQEKRGMLGQGSGDRQAQRRIGLGASAIGVGSQVKNRSKHRGMVAQREVDRAHGLWVFGFDVRAMIDQEFEDGRCTGSGGYEGVALALAGESFWNSSARIGAELDGALGQIEVVGSASAEKQFLGRVKHARIIGEKAVGCDKIMR